MAIIYKIQNKVNKKVYIGQSRSSLDNRLNNTRHGHFIRAFNENCSKPLYNALRKYGKEGFTYEILEEKNRELFSSEDAMQQWLDEREKYWISFYNSSNLTKGYNLTDGGQGPSNYHCEREPLTKEQKKRVSEGTRLAMQRKDVKEKMQKGFNRARKEGKLAHNQGRTYVSKGELVRFVFPEEADRLVKEEGFTYGHSTMSDILYTKYDEDKDLRRRVSEGTKQGMWKPEARRRYILGQAKRFGQYGLYKDNLWFKFPYEQIEYRLNEGWLPWKEHNEKYGDIPIYEGIITEEGTIKRKEGQ